MFPTTNRTVKQLAFFVLCAATISSAGFILLQEDAVRSFFKKNEETQKAMRDRAPQTAEKQVSLPPPLRAAAESAESFLTRSGVVWQTNIHRSNASVRTLKENKQLDAAAEVKLKDMFNQQYFAHVSPKGIGIDGLAQAAGYEYIAIGENLALGNFENDKILVQAWMDSEGHRENILSASFTEIGVAVGRGMYEGRMTWLAVQEFGRPLSDCPQPSGALKAQIDGNEVRLDQLAEEADARRSKLDSVNPKPWSDKRGSEYSQKVDEYNALVEQYNNLLEVNKELIADYNKQVEAFNVCAAQ